MEDTGQSLVDLQAIQWHLGDDGSPIAADCSADNVEVAAVGEGFDIAVDNSAEDIVENKVDFVADTVAGIVLADYMDMLLAVVVSVGAADTPLLDV